MPEATPISRARPCAGCDEMVQRDRFPTTISPHSASVGTME